MAPSISPDGTWVVFMRKDPNGDWYLWKIPIGGTPAGKTAVQITSTRHASDWYPVWSSDGSKIFFERINDVDGPARIYSINADGTGLDSVLTPVNGIAVTPGISPDRRMLIMGVGTTERVATRTMSSSLTRQLAVDKAVENYPDHDLTDEGVFPILSPRVSPDGTRLALRASPPAGGLPEIWAARRNMSLPPQIDNLGGTVVNDELPLLDFIAFRGYPFSLVVEASDPEGDPLTYQAFFLREDLGMSFDYYTQTLSWTPPDTVDISHSYYVRFQVETASGGTDYAIARISVATGSGGGGCPTLATYTGRGWRTENTLLGRSKDGRYLTDTYKLHEKAARVHDRYRLEIRENEQEQTTLDQVRLLAVDHDPKLQAYACEQGVWLGERRPAHRVRTAGGEDVTHLLGGSGEMFAGSPGDILLVEMDDPEAPGGTNGIGRDDPEIFEEPCCEKNGPQPGSLRPGGANTAAAVDAAVLDGTGLAVQAADAVGAWGVARALYPREGGDEAVVAGAGHGMVRVAFKGRQHLKFVGKLANATKATPRDLPLTMARHSRHKDVASALTALGGAVTTLEPGETLSLEFEAPVVGPGLVRDLFLVSRGVYTAWLPDGGQSVGIPARFALAQSQPNPAAGPTLIRFELPVKAKVKLEVFDLLGRRIRVLADREFEPGYQSVEWDRKDRSGATVNAGIYLYRMTAPGFRDQKKMPLLP